MKVYLVSAPFYSPASMPIGISYLKSYIETKMSDVIVKTIDLNIIFYKNLVGKSINICRFCPEKSYYCLPPELFTKTKMIRECYACFKDKERFYNLDDYYNSLRYFNFMIDSIRRCYEINFKSFIEDRYNKELEEQFYEILKDDISRITNENPDLIGFSITSEEQIIYTLALIKLLKTKYNLPILIGGAQMAIIDKRELLTAFKFIDYIIYGEGEIALLKFLINFAEKNKNGVLKNIPSLGYRKNNHDIEVNPTEYIEKLSEIPFPDFSDFDIESYLSPEPVFPIIFSKGCTWKKCSFCFLPHFFSYKYRTRTIENLLREIEFQQERFGVKNFWFCDEEIPAQKIEEISSRIIKKRINISYRMLCRPTADLSFKILKTAYNSGLRWLCLGVESLTQRILDMMNKGTRVEDIKRIISNCKKIGIGFTFSYIGYFPTKTEEETKRELEQLYKLRGCLYVGDLVNALTLFKNTPCSKNPSKFGIDIIGRSKKFITAQGDVHECYYEYICNKGAHKDKVLRLLGEADKLFPVPGSFFEHNLLLSKKLTESINNNNYHYIPSSLFLSQFLLDINELKIVKEISNNIKNIYFLKGTVIKN